MASNVTRMKDHLKTCVPYLEDISNAGSWIVDEHNRKRQKSDTGAIIGLGGRKRQATLDIPRLSKQEQDETTKLAAMALYKTGKSFNLKAYRRMLRLEHPDTLINTANLALS